jgi:general stress protein 26
MEKELFGTDALSKIRELVKNIDFCMLSTQAAETSIRSRPMSSNGDIDDDGTIYFFTKNDSRLVDEIELNQEVNVSFTDSKNHVYISISGTAELISDKATQKKHWKPQLKVWFPRGVDSPEVLLVRVTMEEAEYWQSEGGLIAHTIGFAKSLLGGQPKNSGEHGKIAR